MAEGTDNGAKPKKRTWSRAKGSSILSKERKKVILDAVAVGVPFGSACELAGITDRTFRRARAKSEEFRAQVKQAEARLKQGLCAHVLLAAKNGVWTASAWMLERRWPAEFAKTERQEVTGPQGAPLPLTVDRAAYVQAVREALGFKRDLPPRAVRRRKSLGLPVAVEALPAQPLPASVVEAAVIDVARDTRADGKAAVKDTSADD